jgi:hypothetical protein
MDVGPNGEESDVSVSVGPNTHRREQLLRPRGWVPPQECMRMVTDIGYLWMSVPTEWKATFLCQWARTHTDASSGLLVMQFHWLAGHYPPWVHIHVEEVG